MVRYRSKEEQLKLGERATDLRDMQGLKWRVVAEKLGSDIATIIVYYKKYKYGIERGWVWLYENGFKRRVPQEIGGEIEEAKLKNW